MRYTGAIACLLASMTFCSEVQAQRDSGPGFRGWGSAAMGWGRMDCTECDADSSGLKFGVAWGLAANERFLFALSLDAVVGGRYRHGSTRSQVGRDMVLALAPIVRVYPFSTGGPFVSGGVGLGITNLGDRDALFSFLPRRGLGTTFGVGWDVALGESSIAAAPTVAGAWIRESDQTSYSLQIGLGLTIH
jgi:hypothetical protein